jgi:aspartyl protease family protein
MTSDRWADIVLYGLMILLPLSALAARRLPIGTTLKMAAAWTGIFAVALVLVVFARDPVARAWRAVSGGLADQTITGQTVRIRMAQDGHFYADATIDGVPRRMLIDSGATTTAISVGSATAAGLAHDGSAFPAVLETANGRVIARQARVRRLSVGSITAHDLGVVVAPEFGDADVIGMNFLSRLKSWRVEGATLVLEPGS